MDLKFCALRSVVTQLGCGDLGCKKNGIALDSEKVRKLVCCAGGPSGLLSDKAIMSVKDGNLSTWLQRSNGSRASSKDLSSLPSAYSEDAALKAYPHCETVPCNEFEDAFKNSLGGSIHRNYDLLLRHRLHIVGEVQLAVNLCLLALPGVRSDQLKRVLSHPQALAQSDAILSKLGVATENVDDATGAALLVAQHEMRDAGAVASSRAAEIYGLNIVAERSQIESCPQRKRPLRVVDDSNNGSSKYFDYLFYIDFEASMAEPRAQTALGHLQEFATFLRVLGCYPMDVSIP